MSKNKFEGLESVPDKEYLKEIYKQNEEIIKMLKTILLHGAPSHFVESKN